ncbi:MAG: hypothetical protein ABIT09_04410 [Croceibacterium sp.]
MNLPKPPCHPSEGVAIFGSGSAQMVVNAVRVEPAKPFSIDALAFSLNELALSYVLDLRTDYTPTPLQLANQAARITAAGDALQRELGLNPRAQGNIHPYLGASALHAIAKLARGGDGGREVARAVEGIQAITKWAKGLEQRSRLSPSRRSGNSGSPAFLKFVGGTAHIYSEVWRRAPAYSSTGEAGPFVRFADAVHSQIAVQVTGIAPKRASAISSAWKKLSLADRVEKSAAE